MIRLILLSPIVIVSVIASMVLLGLYAAYGWDICLFASGGLIGLLGSIVILSIDSVVRSNAGEAEVAARAEAALHEYHK
jgi:hypothetical protein